MPRDGAAGTWDGFSFLGQSSLDAPLQTSSEVYLLGDSKTNQFDGEVEPQPTTRSTSHCGPDVDGSLVF